MATYKTRIFLGEKNIANPYDSSLLSQPVDVEFPSTALVANDLILLVGLPPTVRLQDYEFHFPDIDTGTPAFAFSFGVANAGQTDLSIVYAAGVTAGQSTTIVRNTTSVAAQDAVNLNAVRNLAIKVTTAAATYDGANKIGQVVLRLKS